MRRGSLAILAGDAAAVGDPFMGEGIGRALGAGPLIQDCLERLGGDILDAGRIRSLYQTAWQKRYGPRLRIGFFVRGFLRSGFFSGLLLRWFLASPRRLQGRLPLIHGAGSLTGLRGRS